MVRQTASRKQAAWRQALIDSPGKQAGRQAGTDGQVAAGKASYLYCEHQGQFLKTFCRPFWSVYNNIQGSICVLYVILALKWVG